MDEGSHERLARNEALFREVNERIRDVAGRFGDDRYDFVCECADPECTVLVTLLLAEYEQIRADGTHFVVAPGHVAPTAERVIREGDGFVVVEKLDEAAELAEELDPRSD